MRTEEYNTSHASDIEICQSCGRDGPDGHDGLIRHQGYQNPWPSAHHLPIPATASRHPDANQRGNVGISCHKIGPYTMCKLLGTGGFASVYQCTDPAGQPLALKISKAPVLRLHKGDDVSQACQQLQNCWRYRNDVEEWRRYQQLDADGQGTARMWGIPAVHARGLVKMSEQGDIHSYLAMQMLGRDLGQVARECTMDCDIFCRTAYGMLNALQYIHQCGLVHRDVKTSNFCLDSSSSCSNAPTTPPVYIVDYGFMIPMASHNQEQYGHHFVGTPDFGSSRALHGCLQGPRDDLESLAYCLLELWKSHLPWSVGSSSEGRNVFELGSPGLMRAADRRDAILEALMEQGQIPSFLATWVKYVKGLAVNELPQYDYLRKLIRQCLLPAATLTAEEPSGGSSWVSQLHPKSSTPACTSTSSPADPSQHCGSASPAAGAALCTTTLPRARGGCTTHCAPAAGVVGTDAPSPSKTSSAAPEDASTSGLLGISGSVQAPTALLASTVQDDPMTTMAGVGATPWEPSAPPRVAVPPSVHPPSPHFPPVPLSPPPPLPPSPVTAATVGALAIPTSPPAAVAPGTDAAAAAAAFRPVVLKHVPWESSLDEDDTDSYEDEELCAASQPRKDLTQDASPTGCTTLPESVGHCSLAAANVATGADGCLMQGSGGLEWPEGAVATAGTMFTAPKPLLQHQDQQHQDQQQQQQQQQVIMVQEPGVLDMQLTTALPPGGTPEPAAAAAHTICLLRVQEALAAVSVPVPAAGLKRQGGAGLEEQECGKRMRRMLPEP